MFGAIKIPLVCVMDLALLGKRCFCCFRSLAMNDYLQSENGTAFQAVL